MLLLLINNIFDNASNNLVLELLAIVALRLLSKKHDIPHTIVQDKEIGWSDDDS